MRPIIEILLWLLQLYVWLIIITAVMSWLITFNVINMRNDGKIAEESGVHRFSGQWSVTSGQ